MSERQDTGTSMPDLIPAFSWADVVLAPWQGGFSADPATPMGFLAGADGIFRG